MSFFWNKLLVRSGIARWLPSVRRLLGGSESFLRYFSDRTLSCPVRELLDPALFPDVQGPDSINLALGSPRCELPLGALRGLHDQRPLPAWGLPELREAIQQMRKEYLGPVLHSTDEVLITHGAAGAFATAIDTFINPGSPVVLFDPTSPIFSIGLQHRRAKIRWVSTHLEEGHTRFALDEFTRAMRGAKMLVLCDPCNPTGGLCSVEDLEQIAFWAKKYDVLIYLDESFAAFRPEPPKVTLDSLPSAENRLLVAGSFSKSHGLSAARVGWLMANRHLLQACTLTASMAAPFVSPLSQHVALTALRNGKATLAAIHDEFAGRRRYVAEQLQALGLPPAWTASGYFFWINVAAFGLTGKQFSQDLMTAKRVLVNPGEPFGPSGSDYIRISFAAEEGRLREGIARVVEFVREWRIGKAASLPASPNAPENVVLGHSGAPFR
jgi:aspartate/methionine/tyrosine aminotransferase